MTEHSEAPATATAALREAWAEYHDTLESLREEMENARQFQIVPEQRGLAYWQLMQIQAQAYNFAVGPRTAEPRVFHNTSWQTDLYTIGGNGPDFDYRCLFLDGRHTYVLRGNINDTRMAVAQVNSAVPGQPHSRCIANYDFADFTREKNGSFEIVISAEKHEGNWMQLDAQSDYHWLLVRPTVETSAETPASFSIERVSPILSGRTELEEFSEEAIARRIGFAVNFMRFAIIDWSIGYWNLVLKNSEGRYNEFVAFNVVEAGELGSPAAQYLQVCYQVDEEEALVIEMDEEPVAEYWSFELFDVWQNPLFFRTRRSALNGKQVRPDPDGKIRIVLSERDPGYLNWLDNAGFSMGQVIWRNYKSQRDVGHRIYRVKLSNLSSKMHPKAERTDPAERLRELAERKEGYRLRHHE
jgi:hypothetical protein